MTRLGDFPAAFIEALCVHEAFGRLGFAMEDVHFSPDGARDPNTGQVECAVFLRAQCRQFVVTVGTVDRSRDAIAADWTRFAKLASEGAFVSEFETAYAGSTVARNAVPFLVALLQKGFVFPRDRERTTADA